MTRLYLGMIAIDAALVDFTAAPLKVIATSATAFEPALKQRVAALIDSSDQVALDEIGQIDVEIGRAFARAAGSLLKKAGVSATQLTAIGSHGQTLRHRPDLPAPFTWQIGDPNVIAELTGATVVADFRRRDVAAGGQGAPLLPVFHDQVFRSDAEDRVIVNLGGIANITILKRDSTVTGFDTGPANRLLDAWISRHEGRDFDADGAWAAGGSIDATLLQELLHEPYLRLPPPKSTGRELFNLSWLQDKLGLFDRRPRDVQATLQQYTAVTVADAARHYAPGASLYVCGGGARNVGLLAALAALSAPNRVASTEVLGLDPDYVEAIAFAWFAKRTLEGLTSSAGSVTGAKGARILGGVYRYA
jgi:anhydro-N-acetylmuramic acid kinase